MGPREATEVGSRNCSRFHRVQAVKVRAVASANSTGGRVVGVVADAGPKRRRGAAPEPLRAYLEAQGFTGAVGQCVASPADGGGVVLHVGLGPATAAPTPSSTSPP